MILEVLLGPNAIIAFKREGYRRSDFSLNEFCDSLKFRYTFAIQIVSQFIKLHEFSGTLKLLANNIGFGVGELYRGLFLGAQVKLLRKYIPLIQLSDVERYAACIFYF
jgi:hypothetical protein